MEVGDILDETIRLYRQQALVYIGVMALTFVPLSVVAAVAGVGIGLAALLSPERFSSVEVVAGAGLVAFIILVLYFLAFLLSQGASTVVAAGGFLARPVHLLPALRTGARHLLGLVALSVALGALVTAAALADLGLSVGLLVLAPSPLTLALLLLRVPIGLGAAVLYHTVGALRRPATRRLAILVTPFGVATYCAVRWALCFQALVLEGLGVVGALRRSWRLVEGYWMRTLTFLVLLAILSVVLQVVPGFLLAIPLAPFEALSQPQAVEGALPITSLVANFGSALGWIIFGAVQWLAATVYYYDLRIRQEAFDLELHAQRLRERTAE